MIEELDAGSYNFDSDTDDFDLLNAPLDPTQGFLIFKIK
jgi:hypothetical protein